MSEQLTDILARHLEAADFDVLPPEAVARAKTRLLDSIGLFAAGRRAQGSDAVLTVTQRWGGRPDATILTTRTKVPAMHAAFANAVLVRSYDFEPVGADLADGTRIPSHITGTTVPVALAVAEARRANGRELLTALIYGDDLAARLGHAAGFDVYGGGDNTGTINALGGVATAGILMGLDARRLSGALGVAVNQLGGTIDNINDKTLAFKLPIALSARNAVFSAELAEAGYAGPDDPIGGRFGFLAQWAKNPDRSAITDGLGSAFFADAVIKPWPTCRASQPSLDATVRLVDEHGIRAEDVEQCVVHVTPRVRAGFVGQPFTMGASPEVSGAFSIVFAVATALLHGTVALRHMNPAHMTSPALRDMLDRVELRPSLAADDPRLVEVELRLRSGAHHRMPVEHALGDIRYTPLSEARIIEKFHGNIAWAGLSPATGELLRDIVRELEDVEDVSRLAGLLAAER